MKTYVKFCHLTEEFEYLFKKIKTFTFLDFYHFIRLSNAVIKVIFRFLSLFSNVLFIE
jgi:hypothetical protein